MLFYVNTPLLYLISISEGLFRLKKNKVKIENTVTDGNKAKGERKCLSDDISIIGTRTQKTCVQCVWYGKVALFALKIQIKNEAICVCVFECYTKRLLHMAKKKTKPPKTKKKTTYMFTCTCYHTRIILSLNVHFFQQVKTNFFCVTQ